MKIWYYFVTFFQVSDILFSGEYFHTIEEINGNEENNGNQYTVPQALSQAKSEEPKFILFVSGKKINFFVILLLFSKFQNIWNVDLFFNFWVLEFQYIQILEF